MLHENPCLTIDDISYFLESTAQKIGSTRYTKVAGRPNGTWNKDYGYGLVDAYAAVFKASNPIILENKIETGSVDYEKLGRIRAGKDVVSGGATGDYIIAPNANINLKAWKSIHLEEGTTIKAGSNFRAYIKDFSGDCGADDWYARTVPDNSDISDGTITLGKSNTSEKSNINIEVFPNPFEDAFNLKILTATPNDYELKVFNTIGAVVYADNGNFSNGKHLLNIPIKENSGLYLIQIRIGNELITKKIMKHE